MATPQLSGRFCASEAVHRRALSKSKRAAFERLLLESKASPDEQNNMGDTAMHEAQQPVDDTMRSAKLVQITP